MVWLLSMPLCRRFSASRTFQAANRHKGTTREGAAELRGPVPLMNYYLRYKYDLFYGTASHYIIGTVQDKIIFYVNVKYGHHGA